MKIKFEFCSSVDAVLERLPTSKIIDQYDDKYLIEAKYLEKE